MGYLPEAMVNYLMRLGWSHGDDEIISRAQAIEWFDLGAVGRSAARFDQAKLDNLNHHYVAEADAERLVALICPELEKRLGGRLAEGWEARVIHGLSGLRERAKTILELAENAEFYARVRPLELSDKARKLLDAKGIALLHAVRPRLQDLSDWSETALEGALRQTAEEQGVKLGDLAQPLRSALTGSNASPGIFEVMAALGRTECVGRIEDALGAAGTN
jgi:glutamyl-tRNA synthetase